MDGEEQGYDLGAIRKLLLAAFTDKDLRRFCRDHPPLRPIVTRFGSGQDFEDLVDRVIDYCETHLLWPEFLAAVKQDNPRQYARFEAKLVAPTADRPMPISSSGEADRAAGPVAPAPPGAAFYMGRAAAREKANDWIGAVADYTEAIALFPEGPDQGNAYYNRGNACGAHGDWQQAIADYDRAICLLPDGPEKAKAYLARGDRRGAWDKAGAIADFTEAITLLPDGLDKAIAYHARGVARGKQDDGVGAIADLTEAIALSPDGLVKAIAYNARGLARGRQDDGVGAIADFTEAIALLPDGLDKAVAWSNRGTGRAQQGDQEGAIADLDRAIALEPQFDRAYYFRGVVYRAMGRKAQAIADLSKYLEVTSDSFRRIEVERILRELRRAE